MTDNPPYLLRWLQQVAVRWGPRGSSRLQWWGPLPEALAEYRPHLKWWGGSSLPTEELPSLKASLRPAWSHSLCRSAPAVACRTGSVGNPAHVLEKKQMKWTACMCEQSVAKRSPHPVEVLFKGGGDLRLFLHQHLLQGLELLHSELQRSSSAAEEGLPGPLERLPLHTRTCIIIFNQCLKYGSFVKDSSEGPLKWLSVQNGSYCCKTILPPPLSRYLKPLNVI